MKSKCNLHFVETKCNFGSLRVAFTFSLQLRRKNDIIYIMTQHCGVEKWIMQRLAFLITAFGNC